MSVSEFKRRRENVVADWDKLKHLPTDELAEYFGYPATNSLTKLLQRNGLETEQMVFHRRRNNFVDEWESVADHMDYPEIQEHFGYVHRKQLYKKMREHGMQTPNINQDFIEDYTFLRGLEVSHAAIAKRMNVQYDSLMVRISRSDCLIPETGEEDTRIGAYRFILASPNSPARAYGKVGIRVHE